MSDGVVTRLGRDVVNVEGAQEMAGRVDSCLRRNDGRDSADADEGAGMTGPKANVARYSPLNSGWRPSAKARGPSLESAVWPTIQRRLAPKRLAWSSVMSACA